MTADIISFKLPGITQTNQLTLKCFNNRFRLIVKLANGDENLEYYTTPENFFEKVDVNGEEDAQNSYFCKSFDVHSASFSDLAVCKFSSQRLDVVVPCSQAYRDVPILVEKVSDPK